MRKNTLLLVIILLAAAVFRFYQIDTNPKAMYGDGLTAVYDAYSILKTGHDQKGNFLPLVFSLGGGRPGGYVYATVPFVALFGPTALASQMVSVLSGIGIIFLLYLLGKKLLSEKIGLAIAAVAALNPWELSLSRGPFESHFALFLTLLGFYGFLRGLKEKYWFLLFALSFSLATQTYSTYRLTIPLLAALLLLFYLPTFHAGTRFNIASWLKKPILLLSLVIIIASAFLSVYLTVSRGKEDRFDIINIFKDPALRSAISQKVAGERSLSNLSPAVSHALLTPQIELLGVLAENYFQNLLPDFLYIHGDGQVRHNPAEMGGFYWIDGFFLILGIIYLLRINRPLLILMVGWILIAPVPASLVGGPHALRSSLMLSPLLILTGIGLWRLPALCRRPYIPLAMAVLLSLFFIQFLYFTGRFYLIAPQKNARAFSYPAKTASIFALENREKFDYIILSNDIDNMEFAYPAYAKLDPNLVIAQNRSPAKINEFKFFKYNNVYIGSLPSSIVMRFIKELPGSVLYIGAGKEQPNLENYQTIRGFDGENDLVITAKSQTPDPDLK